MCELDPNRRDQSNGQPRTSNILPRLVSRWIAAFLCICGPVAVADSVDANTDYFRGKTLTYIVGTQAGGSYDTYARLIGRYMEKFLPETKIMVRNVPGAGHIIAANLLSATRPDGLTIATLNTGLLYAQLFNLEGIRFDLAKFEWIGKASSDPQVLMLGHASPIGSLDELTQSTGEPILLGTTGIGSSAQTNTALLSSLLNLNARAITGYSGQEVRFSIVRGDLHGMVGSLSALRLLVDQRYGKIVLRIGGEGETALADLPEIGSLVTGEDAARIVEIMRQTTELGRFTAAPPGVPPERLKALRQAYQRALEDPGLVAEAKRLQLPLKPLYGEEVAHRVQHILDLPETTMRLLRENVGCQAEEKRCIPLGR